MKYWIVCRDDFDMRGWYINTNGSNFFLIALIKSLFYVRHYDSIEIRAGKWHWIIKE